MPPVANTLMPASAAAIIVADTVVPAQPPSASASASVPRDALRGRRRDGELLELGVGKPDHQPTLAHGHGRRLRPAGADGRLGAAGRLDAHRMSEAVGDQRRLERDDGRPAASASATRGATRAH